MEFTPFTILWILLIGFVLLYFGATCLKWGSKSGYRYLGSVYRPSQGGEYTEYNEECLGDERRHCMLTNGMTGKCVLNGICASDFMVDARQEEDDVPKPYCTRPYSGPGCKQFCACLDLKGDGFPGCDKECRTWFHPYFRDLPV